MFWLNQMKCPLQNIVVSKCRLLGLLLALFWLLPGATHAQPEKIRFQRQTVEDGLASSAVACFLQDRRGLMWIGTADGLNCYRSPK
jgi:ligand-binding sensor domain-containing protein